MLGIKFYPGTVSCLPKRCLQDLYSQVNVDFFFSGKGNLLQTGRWRNVKILCLQRRKEGDHQGLKLRSQGQYGLSISQADLFSFIILTFWVWSSGPQIFWSTGLCPFPWMSK